MKTSYLMLTMVLMMFAHQNSANADPVLWYADDVRFSNGRILFGTFVYDADTGVMSNAGLLKRRTVVDETSQSHFFRNINTAVPGNASFISLTANPSFPDVDTFHGLRINLMEPMTNAGGSVEIDVSTSTSFEGACETSDCSVINSQRTITRGRFVAAQELIQKTRWHFYDYAYDDGGMAKGYFDMLNGSNEPGDFDIRTTPGSTDLADQYTYFRLYPTGSSTNLSLDPYPNIDDYTGVSRVQFKMIQPLALYGGINIHDNEFFANFEYRCSNSSCSGGSPFRDAIPGRGKLVAPILEVSKCNTPNLLIPDDDAVGITDDLESQFSGEILDLNISVQIPHARVGDLTVTLENIATGGIITLMSNQVDANGEVCDFENVESTYDDDNTPSIQGVCQTTGSAVMGSFAPVDSLTAFDGTDFRDDWRLRVVDTVNSNVGTLNAWCVHASLVSGPDGRDIDGDDVDDELDNCTLEPNTLQIDSDADGIGNACDPDIGLPNDCQVNFIDYTLFVAAFGATPGQSNWNADADMNSDDVVNFLDTAIFAEYFLRVPGPSTTANLCL